MTRLNTVAAAALISTLFVLGCQDPQPEETAPQTSVAEPQPPQYPHEQIPDTHAEATPAEPAVTAAPEAEATTEEPITTISPEPAAPRTTKKTAAKPKEKYAPAKSSGRSYTVRKGDTLQEISQKFYGTTRNWRKIADANKSKLKDPNKLTVGTKLVIP